MAQMCDNTIIPMLLAIINSSIGLCERTSRARRSSDWSSQDFGLTDHTYSGFGDQIP